jgi:hypothetical protein
MKRDNYRKRATTPPGVCLVYQTKRERVMSKLICHADECDNSTSETFFHCEQHGGEDGEGDE